MTATIRIAETGPALRCRVRHHLPRRTRLSLKGAWPKELEEIRARLATAGFDLAGADPRTRGLLVHHPPLDAATVALCLSNAIVGHALPDLPTQPREAPKPPRDERIRGRREMAATEAASQDRLIGPLSTLTPDGALTHLDVTAGGLTPAQVLAARATAGPNLIPRPEGRSTGAIIAAQASNLPTALLAGSAVLSLATGGVFDAVVTLAVIGINVGIGFTTERLIRRLSKPVEHPASVLRESRAALIAASEVVPGDILVLAPGMVVSADARLIAAGDLTLDESALTGESLPVEKTAAALAAPPEAVAERHNIVHSGTVVTGGDGLAVVFRTGAQTEAARTHTLIGQARAPRPLIEEKLEGLSRNLALACIGASTALFIASRLRGEPFIVAAKSAIALAVSAIPEGLPAVATTTLALGARAMERESAFVHTLPAIEAIGSVDTICLDKTGTLTRNEMVVVSAACTDGALDYSGSADGASKGMRALGEAMALCSEAKLEPRRGSATELALLDFATGVGIEVEQRRAELPLHTVRSRNHLRRFMATEHEGPPGNLIFVKGAPEDVLALCAEEMAGDLPRPLSVARRAEILALNEAYAARGLARPRCRARHRAA